MRFAGRLLAALVLCAVIILAAGAVRGAKANMADDVMLGSIVVNSGNTSGPGWSYDAEHRVLTLSDLTVSGSSDVAWYDYWDFEHREGSAAIRSLKDLTIVLEGENRISGAANIGIFVRGSLLFSGTGSLTISGATDFGIWVEELLGGIQVTGGTITVTGAEKGIMTVDDLEISAGSVKVTAGSYGIGSLKNVAIRGAYVSSETQGGTAVYTWPNSDEVYDIALGSNVVIKTPKNGYVTTLTSQMPGGNLVDYKRIVGDDPYGRPIEAESVVIGARIPNAIKVSPEVAGGEVDVPATAMPGEKVTLGVKAGSAPALKWQVTDADGDPVPVDETDNSFVMPTVDVTVFAWFSNPVVTLEFGEAHEGFVRSRWAPRVGQGGVKGVSGSQVYIEIEAGIYLPL